MGVQLEMMFTPAFIAFSYKSMLCINHDSPRLHEQFWSCSLLIHCNRSAPFGDWKAMVRWGENLDCLHTEGLWMASVQGQSQTNQETVLPGCVLPLSSLNKVTLPTNEFSSTVTTITLSVFYSPISRAIGMTPVPS